MAIEKKDRTIILTEETAKSFNYKIKSINPSIIYKRDRFIQESKDSIKIDKSNGKITLTIKQ